MISGTLSLYLGSAEQVNAYCPADVVVEATYYSSSNEDHVYNDETGEETIEYHTPFDAAAMDAWFEDYFAAHKLTPSSAKSVEYYSFTAVDAAGVARALGEVGTVSVKVTCAVELSDISLPGVPGTVSVSATRDAPVDPLRGR